MDNSIVASCIAWKSKNWAQASPVIKRLRRLTEPSNEFDHALVKLLNRPNPHYSSRLLREALLQDYSLDGTAFIRIIFGAYNLPVALYWMPTEQMVPIYNADGSEWVRYWEYTAGGQVTKLDPSEVIVWKQGVDRATGGRRGRAPFQAGIAEAYSDNEARNTVNAILRNRAQMGMMVAPDGRYFAELVKGGVKPYEAGYNPAQAQEIEARVNSKNTGDRRGSTNVFSVPMSITEFGSVLDKLDSRVLRSFSEERICALFGIHPVVLPMGTGLAASSDKHNMETAQRMSWLNGIVPEQDSFADAINELIPLMDARPDTARFDFDRSQVEALQENADNLSTRVMAQWKDDAITHDELRGRLGYKTDDARKGKYYSELVAAGDPMADDPTQEEDGIKALLRRRKSLELVAEL
jgi:phage portal protein BeeE